MDCFANGESDFFHCCDLDALNLLRNQQCWVPTLVNRITNTSNEHLAYYPRPDFVVVVKRGFPLLVIEIMSQSDEGDSSRMLIYSAYSIRLLFLLWKSNAQPPGATFKASISTWYFDDGKVTQRDVGLEVKYEEPHPCPPITYRKRVFNLLKYSQDSVNLVTRLCQSLTNISKLDLRWLEEGETKTRLSLFVFKLNALPRLTATGLKKSTMTPEDWNNNSLTPQRSFLEILDLGNSAPPPSLTPTNFLRKFMSEGAVIQVGEPSLYEWGSLPEAMFEHIGNEQAPWDNFVEFD